MEIINGIDSLKSLKLWSVGKGVAYVLYAATAILFFKSVGVAFGNNMLSELSSVFFGFTFVVFGIGVLLHMVAECLRRLAEKGGSDIS